MFARIGIGVVVGALVGLVVGAALFSESISGRVWLLMIIAGGSAGFAYHWGYTAAKKDADRQREVETKAHLAFLDRIDRLKEHLRIAHDKTEGWIHANGSGLVAAHQAEHRAGRTHYQLHDDLP